METRQAISFSVLASAFGYPAPDQFERLKGGLAQMPAGEVKQSFAKFLKNIGRLSLGAWEELHTRTLDLNPPVAPYVGFQTWGESYQRGVFLSNMSRVVMEAGIDTDGELPDHLTPVLRYLAQAAEPLPELVEVLRPALKRMMAALRGADPANPYLDLFEAVHEQCKSLTKEAA